MQADDMLNTSLRQIAATRQTEFRPFERYGEPVPKMSWLPLSRDEETGFECYLIRIAPGGASRPHEHQGIEEFLVLEGELEDCDGTVLGEGDFVSYRPGTRHFSRSPRGCLLLVMLRGGSNRAL